MSWSLCPKKIRREGAYWEDGVLVERDEDEKRLLCENELDSGIGAGHWRRSTMLWLLRASYASRFNLLLPSSSRFSFLLNLFCFCFCALCCVLASSAAVVALSLSLSVSFWIFSSLGIFVRDREGPRFGVGSMSGIDEDFGDLLIGDDWSF